MVVLVGSDTNGPHKFYCIATTPPVHPPEVAQVGLTGRCEVGYDAHKLERARSYDEPFLFGCTQQPWQDQ